MKQKLKVKCFSRVQLVNPDGTLAGDSGWTGPNMITNLGIQHFLVGAWAANANSSQINYMAVGTGGTAASNATALPGEVSASTQRFTVSRDFSNRAAAGGTATAYFYATFTSGFIAGAGSTIDNVGLFASTQTAGTVFAANTYTGSACASNQAVNATYAIQLAFS